MGFLYHPHSLALLTDLYEITMAYGYWKHKMEHYESVFHLFFRRRPFHGGFALASGLQSVIDYLKAFRFDLSDLDYLATLKGIADKPLFEEAFLEYLRDLKFSCDLDAVCEGEVVFPYEPLLRIQGPLIQCQLLESPLLVLINFPTLIATKAARICLAAGEDPVLEFGLRRAQGIDGALTASRAAFVGGCSATSNVFAGKVLGVPVRGTHAHSWVMAFDSELESFKAFAEAMPGNCVFLVDTYDTLEGVRNAIEVGKWLKKHKKPFLGIRLDSGDLAYLSIESRKLLDEAGFQDTKIFASNELNETLIADLKIQGAQIGVWGVGTHLVTGSAQSALDGVYKLSALRKPGEDWKYKLKISEQMSKVSDPGVLQVRRYFKNANEYAADMVYDVLTPFPKECVMLDPLDSTRRKKFAATMEYRDLLVPIFRKGECIYSSPNLQEIQDYGKTELSKFDRSIKRFQNPHQYPLGMEEHIYRQKIALVEQLRKK